MTSTSMPDGARTSSSMAGPSSGAAESNNYSNRCIVTRNGALLPWGQIRRRYKLGGVAPDANADDGGERSTRQPDAEAPMDAGTLLQLLPRGAYTTCRTVRGGTHIYQFEYHVRRLALSAQSILETITGDKDDGNNGKLTTAKGGRRSSLSKSNHPEQHHRTPSKDEIYGLNIIDEAWEREMALTCIRSTLDEFRERYPINNNIIRGETNGESNNNLGDEEFRIMLLATWEKRDDTDCCQQEEELKEEPSLAKYQRQSFQSVLYCHMGILPQSSNIGQQSARGRRVRVLVHGHGRENALAKDSKWVIDRKELTKPSKSDKSNETSSSYEEIILLNDDGELLEGTQTNFYVVSGESIVTADEGILHGSVRDSVLRVCRAHDIRVELRPPTLDDLREASGVFITSTSRLVMPVHEVVLGDLLSFGSAGQKDVNGDGEGDSALPPSYCYPNCLTTENIRKWVLEDVETHSTSVYVN